ncbi:MAG TPA: spermidine/putrescine ABC transporter ATP-binding protein [Ruminococcaceae bacterium]|jgi:ABC-type Fe3+/spermidine/putrescine transport system ATPase subunit|nr:spermidine/putrescine ABC transporter ATP-binding protein [Oscillospiraceae bacterium]
MVEIRMENIVKTYRKTAALDGVTLTLKPGTMTVVLGPSGCGKTTLLRILSGLLAADSGRVFFGENDVTALPPQERGAALVFQNYALWPHMSVFDNIAYGLRLKKMPKSEIARLVGEMTELVGLPEDVLDSRRHPTELSGGQQQRVALARALVVSPSLLLLDEPLSNLDAKVRSRLRVYIRDVQKRVGITALYVTHDQEEAFSIADTVVLMDRGKIVQAGTPEEIYGRPANRFAAEFIGDSTVLDGTVSPDGSVCFEGNSIRGVAVHSETPVRPGDAVQIVLRSSDVKIHPASCGPEEPEAWLWLSAFAKEHMYIGAKYRHIFHFGKQTILADSETEYQDQPVRLAIRKDAIRIYKR